MGANFFDIPTLSNHMSMLLLHVSSWLCHCLVFNSFCFDSIHSLFFQMEQFCPFLILIFI